MFKAQADIISAVIIVLIAILLTSAALIWGLPLIQKREDTRTVEIASNAFNQDIPSKIESIANAGGSFQFSLNVDGIWFLNETENTLSFTFFSLVSDKGTDQWIGGAGCSNPSVGFTGQSGTFSIDKPSIICSRTMQRGTGFNTTYKLGYRELDFGSASSTKRYLIKLVRPAGGVSSSAEKSFTISRKSVDQTTLPDQTTLITTKIEILL